MLECQGLLVGGNRRPIGSEFLEAEATVEQDIQEPIGLSDRPAIGLRSALSDSQVDRTLEVDEADIESLRNQCHEAIKRLGWTEQEVEDALWGYSIGSTLRSIEELDTETLLELADELYREVEAVEASPIGYFQIGDAVSYIGDDYQCEKSFGSAQGRGRPVRIDSFLPDGRVRVKSRAWSVNRVLPLSAISKL